MSAAVVEGTRREHIRIAAGAAVALAVSFAALAYSGAFGPEIVRSVITATGVAEGGAAVAIVNAVLAGSTVAAAVGAVIGFGIGGAAIGTIRWAIATFGKQQAIN